MKGTENHLVYRGRSIIIIEMEEEDRLGIPQSVDDDDNSVFNSKVVVEPIIDNKIEQFNETTVDEVEEDTNATSNISEHEDAEAQPEKTPEKRRPARRTRRKPSAKELATSSDDEKDTNNNNNTVKPVVDDKRAEARKDFDDALAKIKQGRATRRRHPNDSSDVTLDDDAIALFNKMQRAVQEDNESVMAGRPALRKLELLPAVLETINKQHMLEFLLDNRLLEAIRMWMEPLPNGTLPSVDLRLSLLQALYDISPSIDTQLLRESRVGRIVMFFSNRRGEFAPIQRLASQLVILWSRPIVGHSNDYRASNASAAAGMMQSEQLRRRGDLDSPKAPATISKLLAKGGQRRRK
jgi:transcription factor SPN1